MTSVSSSLNPHLFSLISIKPIKLSPPNSSLRFKSKPRLHAALSSFKVEEDDDHVIGDCVVFEEDIFDDPFIRQHDPKPHDPLKPKRAAENLVPEEWKETQAAVNITKKERRKIAQEMEFGTRVEKRKKVLMPIRDLNLEEWKETQAAVNITKKERRKIAQEMEFGTRVEKRKKGLMPIRDLNLEEYRAYREAKLNQLRPLSLESFKEEENVEGEDNVVGSGRVEAKNPRWAVYGKGMEDVSQFFNSGVYEPGAKKGEGPRPLFTKEEKLMMNRRYPDIAAATSSKWLPLHTFAASGEYYLMDALLKHEADIDAVDKNDWTVLHKAIIGKNQAVTNYLLRESANPFVRDRDGATLMHYAVRTASSQAIKILLLYNVDINLQDNDGWTPLHLAVQGRRVDVVRLLLIKGADKTLKNKDGLTPLELCLHSGRDTRTYELIKTLKLFPKTR